MSRVPERSFLEDVVVFVSLKSAECACMSKYVSESVPILPLMGICILHYLLMHMPNGQLCHHTMVDQA